MPQTIEIVRVEAARTKYNDRFWRTVGKNGERCSIFNSAKPDQNTFKFFDQAGYGEMLDGMQDDEVLELKSKPITASVVPDGNYLRFVGVEPVAGKIEVDAQYKPNLEWYKQAAIRRAKSALDFDVVWFDTETTGLDLQDEIISISILRTDGSALFDAKIKPIKPYRDDSEAAKVTGITSEDLKDALHFDELAVKIGRLLHNMTWGGYNVRFDADMIEQSFMRANAVMPATMGLLDVMVLAAHYIGEWDASKQKFKYWKLSEACEKLGVSLGDDAHDAGADIRATFALLTKIAADSK